MAMENVNIGKEFNASSFFKFSLLMICSVIMIVLAMPNTEKPRLTYEIGNPWHNMQLISPGEILILKTPAMIAQERQEALQSSYLPYYSIDKTIAQQQIDAFVQANNANPDLPAYCIQSVVDILAKLYDRGILSQNDYQRLLSEDTLASFFIVSDKEGVRTPVRNCISDKQAYKCIFEDKRVERNREALLKCNINEYIVPNLKYDSRKSEQAKHDIIAGIANNTGVIKPGQAIINRGDIVTEEKAREIDSYNAFIDAQASSSLYDLLRTNGMQCIYVLSLVIMLMIYIQMFRRDYLYKGRSIYLLFCMLTIFSVLNSIILRLDARNVYLLPICLIPMFLCVFLDSRTAFMTHIVTVLICSVPVSDKFEFIFVNFIGGVVTICTLRNFVKRSSVIMTAVHTALACIVAYTIIKYLDNKDLPFDSLQRSYLLLITNGILLLLAYPLMFLLERTFGFISPITLIELSDTNRGILRELSESAPGTFQHSITVANLAFTIATKIGAKSLLVRTGALYHDIGKLSRPSFFTENQNGINPHSHYDSESSAKLIIAHVKDGVELAKANGVPDIIRNFILTHHGYGVTRYFYNTYVNKHPDEQINDAPFRYPGPNPFSKEQAILMMADAAEAASRSLPKYNEESITTMVNKVIDAQVAEGYFSNCPITFRDISTAKRILIERLGTIYHPRIQYPEINKKKETEVAQ